MPNPSQLSPIAVDTSSPPPAPPHLVTVGHNGVTSPAALRQQPHQPQQQQQQATPTNIDIKTEPQPYSPSSAASASSSTPGGGNQGNSSPFEQQAKSPFSQQAQQVGMGGTVNFDKTGFRRKPGFWAMKKPVFRLNSW